MPQHQKNNGNQNPGHMHAQYGRNDLPNPQRPAKRSALSRLREKFQEKPVTEEELVKLKMKAQKETYKTQIQKAKSSRPSRFSGLGGGGGSGYSGRRSSGRSQGSSAGSWLLDNNNSGGGFLSGGGSGPSLDFITGNNSQPARRGSKPQRSGLEDMFT